jgi:hypothetical protein
MDIRPPKPPEESFTIAKARWLQKFSQLVGGISGLVVLLDQAGAGALLPSKFQKYVTPGVLTVGLLALYTGNQKQASALIADRASKPDIFSPTGTPGRNEKDALFQVFMTAAQLKLAEKATAGELVPANTAQKQVLFEEKILGKLDQFKPVIFPSDNGDGGAALPPVDTIGHYPPNPPSPSPTPGLGGFVRTHSLSDLATIAEEKT